jgi:hypothetical protein
MANATLMDLIYFHISLLTHCRHIIFICSLHARLQSLSRLVSLSLASSVSLSPRTREQLQPAGPACQLSTPPPPALAWAGAQLFIVAAAGATADFCCLCLPRGKYLQHNEAGFSH